MKCVVIGGGLAGLITIVGLRRYDKNVEIILVEPKTFTEYVWATYRSPFDKKNAEQSVLDIGPFLKKYNVNHVQAIATKLTETAVTLNNGTTVEFDVCVVCTGAGSPWKGLGRGAHVNETTRDERLAALQAEGERLFAAKHVVVVGGGLIGTEFAGDLAYYKKQAGKMTPDSTITLIHSSEYLCPEMSAHKGIQVQKKLEKLGVKVIVKEKAFPVEGKENTLKLQSSGEELQADEIVMTVGNVPVNSYFMDDKHLDSKGWIDTDDYFRVKNGGGRIFSLGDCCTTLPCQAVAVLNQPGVIGYNVSTTLKELEKQNQQSGAAPKEELATTALEGLKLKTPFLMPLTMLINTVGPKDGVVYTDWWIPTYGLVTFKQVTMFFFHANIDLGMGY